MTKLARRVLDEIEKRGVLLATDPELPSVTRIVAGEPVRGSWWGHPKGRAIYAVLTEIEDEASVLLVKLIAKKQTFVHRSLWPELFAVATSGEPWQTRGLTASAKSLLEKVEEAGTLRVDELPKSAASPARALEERLLVHGSQVHTESGAHAKILTSWGELGKKLGVGRGVDIAKARAAFEARTSGKLPWPREVR